MLAIGPVESDPQFDEPTLEMPVVISSVGYPPAGTEPGVWQSVPAAGGMSATQGGWMRAISDGASVLRAAAAKRSELARRAMWSGLMALLAWCVTAMLETLAWLFRLLRRLAPLIAVVAVLVVGARSLPWERIGDGIDGVTRRVRAVQTKWGANDSSPNPPQGSSNPAQADSVVPDSHADQPIPSIPENEPSNSNDPPDTSNPPDTSDPPDAYDPPDTYDPEGLSSSNGQTVEIVRPGLD